MMQSFHSPFTSPDLQQALHLAHEYRKGGRLAEAATLYRQFLARFPQQPDLLGQLGEVQMQQGDFQAALSSLEQARQGAPGNAQHWLLQTQCLLALDRAKDAKKLISEAIGKGLNHPLADVLLRQARAPHKKNPGQPVPLGEALRQIEALFDAGRHAEAEALAREAQRRHARAPQLWYVRGMAALVQARPEDAIPLLGRAVALDAGMVPALFNLGVALEKLDRQEEALNAYRKTLSLAPNLVDAHNNLGNVLQRLKRHDEALSAYESALSLKPEIAEYHINRGNALLDAERCEEAATAFETAVRLKPGFVEAYVSLAFALHRLERYEEAVKTLQLTVSLRPDCFAAYQGMGHALRELRRHEEAVEAYRHAVELKPDDAQAHKDLGIELTASARYDAALVSLRRALALRPDFVSTANLLAGTLLDMGRHDEALETYRQGLARNPEGLFDMHSNMLLALNYRMGGTAGAMLAEARAFGEKAARQAATFHQHENVADPDRRLRIGLVSGDLGQHPVGFFLQNVVESLDSNKLELFAYETSRRKDALNERLRRSIPHWCDARVEKMGDEALANQVRADGIDVLIDLAGHTGHNRLPVFAWKPAPVQVGWLGYLGTTGVSAVDYVLADGWALPAGEEAQFTETPWRLPESYICFSPPDLPVEVEPLAALDKGCITFGCFNNLNKISDQVVACWARVLQAVPDSRLFLKTKTLGVAEIREGLVARFARFGIAPERLILEGQFASHEAHFRAYHQVDIALDPFPYPGITTTVEALWMGVPVLTLAGQRFISHQGETIMHNAGLPEWIAANEDDYVAKAAAFAGDIKALAALRAGLRERLLVSPLCDAPRFARNFEDALRGMWRKWCERQVQTEETAVSLP